LFIARLIRAIHVRKRAPRMMNSIVVSSIVFVSIFAAAVLGMAIRRILPEDHVGSDAKEV
jgi:hypothetical protein